MSVCCRSLQVVGTLIFWTLGGLCLSGCDRSQSDAPDAVALKIRETLMVQDMPEQVESLRTVYQNYTPDQVVTFAGRIYAESMSPFDPSESSFTVIELPKPGHNHEDPGDCPFCKRELRNAKFAIVKIVDDKGNSIPRSADKLIGLRKNQDLVVTGAANQVGDTLILRAEHLHVLSPEDAQSLSVAFHPANSE